MTALLVVSALDQAVAFVVTGNIIDPAQKRYNTVPHSFRVFAE
jgi:hypothetical protein